MIRINLLPKEFRHPEPRRFKLPAFVSPKGLLMFLAVLAVVELALFIVLKLVVGTHFDRLQAEYRNLGGDLKGVREIKRQASLAQEVNRHLMAWMDPSIHWTPFMNDLAGGMEKGVWLTHLQFERREFDAPIKVETADTAAGNASVGAVSAEAKALVARVQGGGARGKKGGGDKEKRVVMVLRGRLAVEEEEAAVVGRFIENLKNQKAIAALVEELKLDEIRRTADSEVPMFDFVVSGVVKRDREKDFFNLP